MCFIDHGDDVVRMKKPMQRRKYGLLSNYKDSVEMEAVESDEDDTLYEARSLRRSEVDTQPRCELLEKSCSLSQVSVPDGF